MLYKLNTNPEPEERVVSVTDIQSTTNSIRDTLEDFFRKYSSESLECKHNEGFRTPLITDQDGITYQAESIFQDYGHMGGGFDGRIRIVEDMVEANRYASEIVPRLNPEITKSTSIDRAYCEKEGLRDILEIPFLSGSDSGSRTIEEKFILYDPSLKEDSGIEELLEKLN